MTRIRRNRSWVLSLATSLLLLGCATSRLDQGPPVVSPSAETVTATPTPDSAGSEWADVVSVEVAGRANAYQFSVKVASPDTGCERYADWWEVVTEDGQLVYRRILAHSHSGEQPFTRSGGPVDIAPDAVVWVRAHMHPGGYGGSVFRGSVQDGFRQAQPAADFAAGLDDAAPQPDGCAF